MSVSAPCTQCQGVTLGPSPIPGLDDVPIAPTHCYGTADRVTPGLLGGFVCSCECRHWPKPDEPRFRVVTRPAELSAVEIAEILETDPAIIEHVMGCTDAHSTFCPAFRATLEENERLRRAIAEAEDQFDHHDADPVALILRHALRLV